MKFLILVLTLVSVSTWANIPSKAPHRKVTQNKKKSVPVIEKNPAYDIKTVITLDGVKSNPKFRLRDGQTAKIEQERDKLFTEVTVKKQVLDGKPAMQMEFIIGKTDEFGRKNIIATPKILANLGEKSSVMIGDKKLVVSATATKVAR
ncbi:MAG: hypothetical protein V4596_07960 [Bdellovibrionota bacterium]